jgi:LPS-assembly protein
VDDCFVLGVNYVRSYNYAVGNAPPALNETYMLQIGLRTIGSYSIPVP